MLLDTAQRAQEAIDAAAAEAAQIIAAAEHQAAEIRQAAHQTLTDAQAKGPGLSARPRRRPRCCAPGPSRTPARR
jgi:ABC-type transporter Mla subunit MlaD